MRRKKAFLLAMMIITVYLATLLVYVMDNYDKAAFKPSLAFKVNSASLKNLSAAAEKINKKRKAGDITFQFITDTHYSKNVYGKAALKHFQELKTLCHMVDSDFIIHGGDFIDGNYKKRKSTKLLKKGIKELLKDKECPILIARGNHDDNYCYNYRNSLHSWKNVIPPIDLYESIVKDYEDEVVRDKENQYSMYYYKDFPNKKLRVIVLDTNDYIKTYNDAEGPKYNYEMSMEQVKWVFEKALNFNGQEDRGLWKVLVFSHMGFCSEMNYNQKVKNGDGLVKTFELFKAGGKGTIEILDGKSRYDLKVDFNVQGPMELIAMISGDSHEDRTLKKDGILYVMTLNCVPVKFKSPITPKRVLNTDTEAAFDTFVLDTENRVINIIRYGAGRDRVLSY